MAVILKIHSFQDMETREEDILTICNDAGKHIIIDCSELKQMASSKIFSQLVFFAKVASEHARRQYRIVPKIIVVTADNNPELIFRLEQLKKYAGLDIEFAASIKIAKKMLGNQSIWQVLNFV